MIVADASLLAHLLIPGPDAALAEAVFRRDVDWCAPLLWRSELRSVLLKHIRNSGLSLDLANAVMEEARRIIGGREASALTPAVLEVALRFNVSAYDAEYLAVAEQFDISLVTFDRKLRSAAPNLAVDPERFAACRP
jgi:predicted nucleic acid-binding protein